MWPVLLPAPGPSSPNMRAPTFSMPLLSDVRAAPSHFAQTSVPACPVSCLPACVTYMCSSF